MPSHEIHEQAKKIRYDLTALQAKLTELLRMTSSLETNAKKGNINCITCGLEFQRTDKLHEHLYLTHHGPDPPHWLKAETLAKPTP